MPNDEQDILKDRDLADYVDALLDDAPGEKEADMDSRQLQTLAERLHQLTNAYHPPAAQATRRRLELFNTYRQTVKEQVQEPDTWFGRLSRGLSRTPGYALAAGFVGLLALLVAGALLAPQAGLPAAAGLGGWLPVVVLAAAGLTLLILYFRQRK
jgi:hypothetical protein